MEWLKEFEQNVTTKTAQVFLLYGNVSDDVLFKGEFFRPYEFIPRIESLKPAAVIAFFNLATGVRFPSEEMEKVFLQLVIRPIVDRLPVAPDMKPDLKEFFDARKRDIDKVLDWFSALLLFSWQGISEKMPKVSEFVKTHLQERMPEKTDVPFAVVVFEYQESKTPPESATSSCSLDRRVVETFEWWAQLPQIKTANNLIILVSESLGNVAPQLRDQTKGIISIGIVPPNMEEQKDTIEAFRDEGMAIPVKDISISEMAKLTSGLSRIELRQIFKKAQANKEKLTSQTLFEKKAEIIQANLGDLVRLRKPPWGWEAIGGMDDRIALAMMWAEAMKRGDIARLPKGGILLTGAPGTGKTVFAEALAHELDIPFMEMMNTYNQFVGVSEQNIQNVIDVAWAQRPLVLFIDELDQFLMSRDRFWDGSGGTFSRSNRVLMQFFSDPKIHGQVLIFAATNRPDLLDTAMKRAGRFGAKIPFLIPTKSERPSIWKALLRKEVIRLELMKIKLDISSVIHNEELLKELSDMVDFWEKDGQLMHGPVPDKFTGEPILLTGAEMEEIISMVFQPFVKDVDIDEFKKLSTEERYKLLGQDFSGELVLSGDKLKEVIKYYLPHEDVKTYANLNDLALLSVNDIRFIPPAYWERARELRAKHSTESFLTNF